MARENVFRLIFFALFFLEASSFGYNVTKDPISIEIAANSSIRLFTSRMPEDDFYVFSCHCRIANVTMFPLRELIGVKKVTSMDPAMVIFANETLNSEDPFVFVRNPNSFNVTVIASAQGYLKTDPVPGWCSTRKFIGPKPFLSIAWDSAVIEVNFSRASLPHLDDECNVKHKFEYEIYQQYLPEGTDPIELEKDFAIAIKNFNNIDDIKRLGTKVTPLSKRIDRQLFASYRPIGSLYAVIVHYQSNNISGTSLYGVGHTYGCHIDPVTGLCPDASHVITKIVCGLAVFVGIILAFSGHRLFIMSQFIFGFYAGCFSGYILITINLNLSFTVSFTLTAVCGFLGAILASLLWLVLGIPVLSIFLPTLELGVLAASIVMFIPPLNVPSLTNDLYYWLVFLCIVLAIPGVLLAFTHKASILSCVIIGTYTTIVPIDFFLGTNLRYILLNVLRRATVPDAFRDAIILPPVQTSDVALLACWLGLALLALVTQLIVERKKAPFPPSFLHVMRWRREIVHREDSDSETDPLFEVDGHVTEPEGVAAPVVGYILGYSSVATGLPIQQSHNQQTHRDSRDSPDLRESRRPRLRPSAPPARHRDIFKPPSPDPSLPVYSPRMVGGEV